jgi:hypothetical protein
VLRGTVPGAPELSPAERVRGGRADSTGDLGLLPPAGTPGFVPLAEVPVLGVVAGNGVPREGGIFDCMCFLIKGCGDGAAQSLDAGRQGEAGAAYPKSAVSRQ